MKPSIKHPRLDLKNNPELRELSQLVGDFIEYWGFKSVQGRMWCCLYLIHEPLNSRQLAQLLQISPALVTQSVQVLLNYKVICEAGKGKNGVLRFTANPNVCEAIAAVLTSREHALLEKVQAAQSRLANSPNRANSSVNIDPDRVEQVGQWVGLATLLLNSGIQSLQQEGAPDHST